MSSQLRHKDPSPLFDSEQLRRAIPIPGNLVWSTEDSHNRTVVQLLPLVTPPSLSPLWELPSCKYQSQTFFLKLTPKNRLMRTECERKSRSKQNRKTKKVTLHTQIYDKNIKFYWLPGNCKMGQGVGGRGSAWIILFQGSICAKWPQRTAPYITLLVRKC
jgi:hypothetical protein